MFGARDDGEGAARCRRERRLRSWLKHEPQSVAMALSEFKHHSSRGQKKDRAWEEGYRDKYEAPRRQKPPPPQGSRPPCLGEPRGPQARVQQRTMEQLADVVPMVQILDSPVPQMEEQLLEVFRLLDTQMPVEHAFAVPKISLDRIPQPFCGPRSADGGTIGGSADRPDSFLSSADCQSRSSTSLFLVVLTVVVFKVLSQDRVQQRLVWCMALTSPFVEAFAVCSKDRIRSTV